MKIAVLNNWVPFVHGGAELLAEELQAQLITHGHQAIIVKIPFAWHPVNKVVEHALAARLLSLDNIDRIIAFKYPAYLVKHPNKVLWLLHQFRQAYDLWGTKYQDIPNNTEGKSIRDMIIQSDNVAFKEAKKIYTNSEVVSERLKKYNFFDSEVLYPPIIHGEKYHCREYSDFIFYPSRITRGKRQYLAIQAMKYTKSGIKLIIAGSPEKEEDYDLLIKTIIDNKVEDKVILINEYISLEKKIDYFSRASAVIYIPYDEDSYGYVTLESFQSSKPVLTTTDSGGVWKFVKHNETGFISEPNPKAIAQYIDTIAYDKKRAKRMGEDGKSYLDSLNITWDNTIKKLTGKL